MVNFEKGYFVLVRRVTRSGHKLSFHWIGPRPVSRVKSSQVFVVEDILYGRSEVNHLRRLQLYRSEKDGAEANGE